MLTDIKHHMMQTNGIEIHYVEQGEGPLVVLCHGFPESWYSWRNQISAIANAGYRVVAPDMRGYGDTTNPKDTEEFSVSHIVGDVVGLVNGLGESQAILVGHDWGGPISWFCGLMRPDMFRAIAVLSTPYASPRYLPAGMTYNQVMASQIGKIHQYYRLYFQTLMIPDAELNASIRTSILGMLYTFSGDVVKDGIYDEGWSGVFPVTQRFIDQLIIPERLPDWLPGDDLNYYVTQMEKTGFTGGLNWYRNLNSLMTILSPFVGAKINQPTLYMYGQYDLVGGNTPEALAGMQAALPNLTDVIKVEGAGHWVQQEKPEEVNDALIKFINSID